MEISKHLLKGVPYKASPNTSGPYAANLPDTIVVHYTAGPSASSAINTFLNGSSKASAHLVIDADGNITQMVPFNTIAWHAGVSHWKDRNGLNGSSIGIELVNAGPLVKTGEVFQAWFGKQYPANEVLHATHRNESSPRYWHCFTEKQISVCQEVCALLIEKYAIKEVLGHEEISPGRKTDPGPAFPLDKLRERLFQHDRSDQNPFRKVGSTSLNIRKGPSASEAKIARALPKDHKVEILDRQGEWVKVRTMAEVEGWVAEEFLKLL